MSCDLAGKHTGEDSRAALCLLPAEIFCGLECHKVGGSRAAAGGWVGAGSLQGWALSSLCLSHPCRSWRCRLGCTGCPPPAPSGMNMAELAQQVVKQELPSEEGLWEALLLGAEVPDPEPLPALPLRPRCPSRPSRPRPPSPIPPPGLQPQPELWGRGQRRAPRLPRTLWGQSMPPCSPTCPRKIWTSCS